MATKRRRARLLTGLLAATLAAGGLWAGIASAHDQPTGGFYLYPDHIEPCTTYGAALAAAEAEATRLADIASENPASANKTQRDLAHLHAHIARTDFDVRCSLAESVLSEMNGITERLARLESRIANE